MESSAIALDKVTDRAVIGALLFVREIAGRQFAASAVIGKAFAAPAFAAAWFVAAITPGHIALKIFALHTIPRLRNSSGSRSFKPS